MEEIVDNTVRVFAGYAYLRGGLRGCATWCSCVTYNGKRLETSGVSSIFTVQSVEVRTLLGALRSLKGQSPVLVVTQSPYLIRGINFWLDSYGPLDWMRKTKDGLHRIQHADQWQEIAEIDLGHHRLTAEPIETGTVCVETERCDWVAWNLLIEQFAKPPGVFAALLADVGPAAPGSDDSGFQSIRPIRQGGNQR